MFHAVSAPNQTSPYLTSSLDVLGYVMLKTRWSAKIDILGDTIVFFYILPERFNQSLWWSTTANIFLHLRLNFFVQGRRPKRLSSLHLLDCSIRLTTGVATSIWRSFADLGPLIAFLMMLRPVNFAQMGISCRGRRKSALSSNLQSHGTQYLPKAYRKICQILWNFINGSWLENSVHYYSSWL